MSALHQRSPRGERAAIIVVWMFGLVAWAAAGSIFLVQVGLPVPQRLDRLSSSMAEDGAKVIATGAALMGTFAIAAAMWVGRLLRTERAVVGLMHSTTGNDRTAPVQAIRSERPRSRSVPPVTIEMIKRLKRPHVKYRRVTENLNVIGRPPIQILHLWVFANEERLMNYVEGAWREFGVVQILRSASSVTPKELRAARQTGALGSLLAQTPEDVDRSLAVARLELEPKRFKTLRGYGMTSGVTFDRYGSYQVHSILCNDAVWQYAVDALLDRVDVVTMDLSGFSEKHQGADYEIGRLIDRFPVQRLIFLVDPWAKKKSLENRLREAWAGMSEDSPNRSGENLVLRLVKTDRIDHSTDQQGRTTTELVSARSDARRIMHHLLGSAGPRARNEASG